MDAAANGRSSNEASLSLQLGPRSLFSAFYKHTQDGCSLIIEVWSAVLLAGTENLRSFV